MKKFLLKVVLFFTALLVIDRACGYTLAYMSEHSKGGYTEHFQYITNKTNEDVLIFGSSRAVHHYNPKIITDSLGLSCYNCGQDGNGIILFYGWWNVISQRYHPKWIVYDITPGYDLHVGEDNHKYLGWLKESYDRDGIKDIFLSIDNTEPYKMMSWMYRYNSNWHQIMADYIHPVYEFKNQGFLPLEGSVDLMRIKERTNEKTIIFDPLKIDYLKKLMEERGGTNIAFVVSPSWYGINEKELQPLIEICNSKNIAFINFGNEKKYIHNAKFFKDGLHLNAEGADEFTKDLMHQLKSL